MRNIYVCLLVLLLLSAAGCAAAPFAQSPEERPYAEPETAFASSPETENGTESVPVSTPPEENESPSPLPKTSREEQALCPAEPVSLKKEPPSVPAEKRPNPPKETSSAPAEKPSKQPEKLPAAPPPAEPSSACPAEVFDVEDWVAFGKEYARKLGLELSDGATGCWDNPITASADNVACLERDLKDRLEFYAETEGITAVWLWAEKSPYFADESLLFVGYA